MLIPTRPESMYRATSIIISCPSPQEPTHLSTERRCSLCTLIGEALIGSNTAWQPWMHPHLGCFLRGNAESGPPTASEYRDVWITEVPRPQETELITTKRVRGGGFCVLRTCHAPFSLCHGPFPSPYPASVPPETPNPKHQTPTCQTRNAGQTLGLYRGTSLISKPLWVPRS